MIVVERLEVGQLRTNCYLVYDNESRATLIIDPGDDGDYIIKKIIDLDLKPEKLIATHGHFDHILAVTELKLAFKIPFLMHKKDEFLLKRMKNSAKHFTGIQADPAPKIDEYLAYKKHLHLNKLCFQVIETPGHTPGSIGIYSKEERFLFIGDLIFADGFIGRTDYKYGDAVVQSRSIEKILRLPGDTLVYSGHGKDFRLELFKGWYKRVD
jgi:hydroxyacylglutathione hydrolase